MEKVNQVVKMEKFNDTELASTQKTRKDQENTSHKMNIEKTCLKHILFVMAICGCYDNQKMVKGCGRLMTIYRIFIFLMLLSFIAKTASGFAYISKSDYFGHAIVLTWNVSTLITFALAVRMNHPRFGNQMATFEFLNSTVLPQMADFGIKFDHVGFKRKQILLCVVQAIVVSVLEVFGVLNLSVFLSTGNTAMTTIPFEKTLLTSFFQAVLLLIGSLEATVPTFYMITISYMLSNCFLGFNRFLDAEMCQNACRLPQTMQTLRQLYTNLCKVVTEFDKDFRYLLGNLFFWNITLGLSTLYVILRVDMETYGIIGLVVYIFWLLLSMATVVIMSVFAALVHEAAHAPLDHIYYINVQDITVEKLAQLNLFLSKLTGTQVGFSTCGLLIITKEFILTIAGVFLTYFAVLYTL